MLLIKTYLAADKFGGLGLFADQVISKNTIVWIEGKTDIIFTLDEFNDLPIIVQNYVIKHGYPFYVDGKEFIELDGDNAKYTNHSSVPNMVQDIKNPDYCIVNCDINPGDELTCDYLELDPNMRYCAKFLS